MAWYWRDFVPPANPHQQGRYLLRFWAVDYKADVWLNGVYAGGHEGGETPFVLDVTDAIKPEVSNCLAVRVLNPTYEPIDRIVLNETPHRNKCIPPRAGSDTNHGGIEDSVELLVVPSVRIEDPFVRPDPKTGVIHIQANVRNTGQKPAKGRLVFTVSPAASGETLAVVGLEQELPTGDTLIETDLPVGNPRLWELNDPYLYRVTTYVGTEEASASFDERSVRCGFRNFRFEACPEERGNGYFRLNGRRIFLRCSHTGNDCPIGLHVPHDPDLLRRDRNHPGVVIWGLLNETNDGPVFRHAVDTLSLIRSLDDSRMVMLNSGRWDKRADIGSLSNPGSTVWENVLSDQHH